MSRTPDPGAARTYALPIEQWHALGQSGDVIPVTICLEGDSMRPLVRRGRDRVTIIPLNRPLRTGDIVLFRGGPKRYVVHRVYRLRGGMVQTLGDNCYSPDPWMPLEDVWGLVIRLERGGRTFLLDTRASRAWGRAWMAVHPVRIFLRRCRRLAGRCVRKLLGKTAKGGGGHGN